MISPKYHEYRELLRKGKNVEASRLAEAEYLEGDRNNPFWLTRQAAALSRSGEYAEAIGIAKQALSIGPSNQYAILAVAEALCGLNRNDEALQYYEEIIGDPKLSSYAKKGMLNCLSALRQWGRMLQLLDIWEMPEETSLQWRAKTLAGQNRLDEAIAVCHRWLELRPDNTAGLWALTDLEIQRDGLEPVLSKFGRLAKIPSRPPVYKEIYASLCRKAGRPELALKQYASLSRTGTDPRIQRRQAFTLAKSGRESEAIPLMEELIKLDPDDFYLHSSYIAASRRLGWLERSLQFYKDLIGLNPGKKSIYGRIRKIENMMHS